jgi:hypothetical protein
LLSIAAGEFELQRRSRSREQRSERLRWRSLFVLFFPFPPFSSSLTLPSSLRFRLESAYYDTLTAAVDTHLGIDLKTADTRPPPAPAGKTRSGFTSLQGGAGAAGAGAVAAGGGKKRRTSVIDTSEGVLGCALASLLFLSAAFADFSRFLPSLRRLLNSLECALFSSPP